MRYKFFYYHTAPNADAWYIKKVHLMGDLNDIYWFCSLFLIGYNEDYSSGPYYIVFTAGMTEAEFNISVNDDNILEETETFKIIINSSSLPNNVTIGGLDEAAVTILDNDGEFYPTESVLSLSELRTNVPNTINIHTIN